MKELSLSCKLKLRGVDPEQVGVPNGNSFIGHHMELPALSAFDASYFIEVLRRNCQSLNSICQTKQRASMMFYL